MMMSKVKYNFMCGIILFSNIFRLNVSLGMFHKCLTKYVEEGVDYEGITFDLDYNDGIEHSICSSKAESNLGNIN